MRRVLPKSIIALCVLALVANVANAQRRNTKLAFTNSVKAGEEFAMQGEFIGTPASSSYDGEQMGLQVVSRGAGMFQASLMRGGLPGAGWDRRTKTVLSGHLDNGDLQLYSDRYVVRLAGDQVSLLDDQGAEHGSFAKIRRISPTLDTPPPADAVVLFDGTSTENLNDGRISDEGLLEVGVTTRIPVEDFRMHLEFRTPYMPNARGQARGNSGVYIQQRYEVQILDSFGLDGVANECGGIYKQKAPDINMALPPLSWQTYDIYFTSARFDAQGKKSAAARITVLHNGTAIHSDYAIKAKTGAGKPEAKDPRPILLQNHGDPVNFRNAWIVPVSASPKTSPIQKSAAAYALGPLDCVIHPSECFTTSYWLMCR